MLGPLITLYYFFFFVLMGADHKFIENIRSSDNYETKITRVVLDLSHKTPYSIFTLSEKPRLVIDLEAENFKKIKLLKGKLINNLRVRKTEQGVIRVVFDLSKEAFINKSFFLDKGNNSNYRLVIDLQEKDFGAKRKKLVKKKKRKFVITIDPGHGGVDPGAVNLKTKEKTITLIAAKELKKELQKYGYKTYLTRNKDVYISLRKRRQQAKNNNSDLFISLHVDSVKKRATRGTSVYTLSERASDRVTAKLAERENKVDLLAGVDLENVDNEVASILLDLTRRDTTNSSSLFAEMYVNFARKNGHRLLKRPHRQAGFAVLKSPDIPSVLIELGFLSNTRDVKMLKDTKARKRLILTLAKAINLYVKEKEKFIN